MARYCCERCGVAPERKGYDEAEIDQESAATLRIAEVNTAFGVLWVLCINCRREWLRFLNSCEDMRTYSEYGFRLEHFRTAHKKTGAEDVEKGVGFIRRLNELDKSLFAASQEWLESGKTAVGERRSKKMDKPRNHGDIMYGYSDPINDPIEED